MIKKVKTDNINVDILFNEIEYYKKLYTKIVKDYDELKIEHDAFRTVYTETTENFIKRLIKENQELRERLNEIPI